MSEQDTHGPEPVVIEDEKTERRFAPQYHVILHDDDEHSYDYVILMLQKLFGKSLQDAGAHAVEVDTTGVTVVDTTTLERAELKRDQIRSYGADPLITASGGSMHASIEPAPQ